MLLGFAITKHSIRDDVTTIRSLEVEFVERLVDEALALFGEVTVSMTGGEPLLHPRLPDLLRICADRGVPWRMVTNGWHMARAIPHIDRYPPQAMRLSLSGGTKDGHDHDCGAGSFERVLKAAALLTLRQIPFWLSMVVDRRVRAELPDAVHLAEDLGALGLTVILPRPNPGSADRRSDLSPAESIAVAAEVRALAKDRRTTAVTLDYGAPGMELQGPCQTFAVERAYIDTRGRLALCCQLSDHGFNETEVVADLTMIPLAKAWPHYLERLKGLRQAQRVHPRFPDPLDHFPCLRCVRAVGKDRWLGRFPESEWSPARLSPGDAR